MNDFSFEHTNLTPDQVKSAIPSRAVPVASAASVSLGGKSLNFKLDNAPSLRLKFSPDGATVTAVGLEINAAGIPYSALSLGSVLLVCYHVPDSQTVHIAVADEKSRLAAVYETWLCGTNAPAREVQRQVYHGYITGSEVPQHRPSATKRLVGKAVQWTGEAGSVKTIYASHMFSSFVPGGSDSTFTGPTDYFELNNHTYLYSRCEIEFSGELVLEVFDLHTMKLIGVRLGINKEDKFAVRTYTADGKVLGQFAAYGPHGAEYDAPFSFPRRPANPDDPASPPATPPKGMRIAYRPFSTTHQMTLDEVRDAAAEAGAWTGAFAGPGKEKRCMPFSDILLRHPEFSVRFGEKEFFYKISGMHEMQFKLEAGAEWKSERYDAFEADEGLAFFACTSDSQVPLETFQYALDFETGLATVLISRLNNEKYTREPTQEWLFGTISATGVTPTGALHGFTTDLVGKSFTWTYSDMVASQHIYSSPESYSWSIIMAGIPGMMWSSPCKYVKIRDEVYMMSWIEHRSQGIQGTILFNLKTMHDCGTCYGIAHNQVFEFNTFGAEARTAGSANLL